MVYVATGISYLVKSFTEKAAACLGFDIISEGVADEARGFDKLTV